MCEALLGSGGGIIVVLEATAMLVSNCWNELRAVQEVTMLFVSKHLFSSDISVHELEVLTKLLVAAELSSL